MVKELHAYGEEINPSRDVAIKAARAHSAIMDAIFRCALWTLLIAIATGIAVAVLVW
jgi:hypothetical protein